MAFATKYRLSWVDQFGQKNHRIDFQTDGFAGTITNLLPSFGAINKKYAQPEGLLGNVCGSELSISFIVEDTDTSTYDADFFGNSYKAVRVLFYIEDVLDWQGFLKNENSTREIHYPYVSYYLSASDGIGDLTDIEYSGHNDQFQSTPLQVLKNCLEFIGNLDQMDILIQLNHQELTHSDSTFENLYTFGYLQNRGMYQDDPPFTDKGVPVHEVLQKITRVFYCQFMQSDGAYRVINGQEYNSPVFGYDYASLGLLSAYPGAVVSRIVDINNFDVPAGNKLELSKAPPIKYLYIKRRNLALSLITEFDNTGFNGVTGWNNGDSATAWSDFSIDVDGRIYVGEGIDVNQQMIVYSDTWLIPEIGDLSGVLTWTINIQIDVLTYTTGSYATHPPKFKLVLYDPFGTPQATSEIVMTNGNDTYSNDSVDVFSISNVGAYYIEIYWIPDPGANYSAVELSYGNLQLVFSGGEGTIYDEYRYHEFENVLGYLREESIINLGDTLDLNNKSTFCDSLYNPLVNFAKYANDSGEDNLLVEILVQSIINDRRRYMDLIRIEIYDLQNQIHYHSILFWNSKYYRIIEMDKDYKTLLVSMTIQEVDNSSDLVITTTIDYFSTGALTSINN